MLITKYGDIDKMRYKRARKQIRRTYFGLNRSVRIFHCKNCDCRFRANFFEGDWSWDGYKALSKCPCCHKNVKKFDLIGPPTNLEGENK